MEIQTHSPRNFYRLIQNYKEAQLLFSGIRLDVFTEQGYVLQTIMSWPQLITGIAGGLFSWLIPRCSHNCSYKTKGVALNNA
jgi:hypothetical protein